MMQTIEQIRNAVTHFGLVSAADFDAVLSSLTTVEPSIELLLTHLVKQGKLTAFQAESMLHGEAEHLIKGDYLLLDRLGEGGMGRVYRARHRDTGEIVALKSLSEGESGSRSSVRRFAREIELAQQLDHPNVANVLHGSREERSSWLVMEYVDGINLQRHVQECGPLPLAEAISYIRKAAEGLAYLHSQKIIHRDIKPSNLVLTKDGRVRIVDLGLATAKPESIADKIAAEDSTLDANQIEATVAGTVDYMPPEQAHNAQVADERSDLYSLGCTLFFLMNGRPLFIKETELATLLAHAEARRPRLTRSLNPQSVQANRLFQRMVSIRPESRFASCSQLLEHLRSYRRSAQIRSLRWATVFAIACFGLWFAFAQSQHRKTDDATPETKSEDSDPVQPVTNERAMRPVDRQPPPLAASPFDANQARAHQEAWAQYLGVPVEQEFTLPDGTKLSMILIPPGEFLMGSSEAEQSRFLASSEETPNWAEQAQRRIPAEAPQHRVRVSLPFWMSRYEIRRDQFASFVSDRSYVTEAEVNGKGGWGPGENGSWTQDPSFRWNSAGYEQRDDHPVSNVSWNDATRFCHWLSDQNRGCIFRLPSEAQWEYACRAGTTTPWSCDESEAYEASSSLGTHAVGKLRANPFGLCDMHGNVEELCRDRFQEDYYAESPLKDPTGPPSEARRVVRGGSNQKPSVLCRSAYRNAVGPSYCNSIVGFRVTATIDIARKQYGDLLAKSQQSYDDPYLRDRETAEWVIARSGNVRVQTADKYGVRCTSAFDLPTVDFGVTHVNTNGLLKADLAQLGPLPGLFTFALDGVAETKPRDLFGRFPQLSFLSVNGSSLRASELFTRDTVLSNGVLSLNGSQVDDDWQFLERFPALATLHIKLDADPGAWKQLHNAKRLRKLIISFDDPVTSTVDDLREAKLGLRIVLQSADDDVEIIHPDPLLDIGSKLTSQGIALHFVDPLDQTRQWPFSIDHPAEILRHGVGKVVIPAGEYRQETLELLTRVSPRIFSITGRGVLGADELVARLAQSCQVGAFTLNDSDLGDSGLAALTRSSQDRMFFLGVGGTNVTEEAVNAFKARFPECQVSSDFGTLDYEHRLPNGW